MDWKKFIKTDFFCIAIILLIACVNILIRPYLANLQMPDTGSYIEAAQFLEGQEVATNTHVLTRILKPVSLWGMIAIDNLLNIGLEQAFLIEVIFFYLSIAVIIFLLLKLFFQNENKSLLVGGAIIFISSYPMLRSGISILPESEAIFLYLLAIFFIYRFYLKPAWPQLLISAFIIILGFMCKEYSALAGALLFLTIVFHPRLDNNKKIIYLIAYVIVSLLMFLPWQIYAYQKFSFTYLDWYKTNIVPFKWSRIYYTIKSLFGVFLLAWFLVIIGIRKIKNLSTDQLFLLKNLTLVSFMIFLWSATDSRLYFVIAPPLVIVAILGIKYLLEKRSNFFVGFIYALILFSNYLWLTVGNKFNYIFNKF